MIITYEYFDREILIDAFEMRLGFVINIERFFELTEATNGNHLQECKMNYIKIESKLFLRPYIVIL